jgi:hypothetical protein
MTISASAHKSAVRDILESVQRFNEPIKKTDFRHYHPAANPSIYSDWIELKSSLIGCGIPICLSSLDRSAVLTL